jgi:hypothetical protein
VPPLAVSSWFSCAKNNTNRNAELLCLCGGKCYARCLLTHASLAATANLCSAYLVVVHV